MKLRFLFAISASALALCCLTSCETSPDPRGKTPDQIESDEMHHRVFYEGWRHPSDGDDDSFFKRFWKD